MLICELESYYIKRRSCESRKGSTILLVNIAIAVDKLLIKFPFLIYAIFSSILSHTFHYFSLFVVYSIAFHSILSHPILYHSISFYVI
jgi:hypothetical protein